MKTIEYRSVDKADWQRGEWDNEPDKRQWQDADTGLPCLIVRGPSGALCGYVGVPETHPYFGKGYDSVDADAHGGLTFADHCRPGATEGRGICHIPGEGETDHVWWLGFDCAHSGDYCPAYSRKPYAFLPEGYETYKTIAYVTSECASLAAQLKRAGDAP